MNNPVYDKLVKCYESIKDQIPFTPKVALILGSGLGDFADGIEMEATIDYSSIDGFPVSTVPGHKGRFIFGHVNGVPAVIMQGRVHYYEGYAMSDVVLPVRPRTVSLAAYVAEDGLVGHQWEERPLVL